MMLLLAAAELQDDAESEEEARNQQQQQQQQPGGQPAAGGADGADQDSEPDSGESSASSVVGEEAPAGPEEPPVPPPGAVVNLQELLERHGLTEKNMRFYDGSKQIGRIHSICGNFKATCNTHGSACSMFVSVSSKGLSLNRAAAVLYRWIADGRAMTHQDHLAFARDLKLQLGMKPK